MAIVAQYQTYYAVDLDHWWESWGGTLYNKILVKEMPDEEVSETTSTAVSSGTVVFIYPLLVSNKYYLDGIIDGHFKICNQSYYGVGSNATNLTGYTVTLRKVDNVGNETTLASVSTDFTYSIATDYLAVPFYLNIINAEITENEKHQYSRYHILFHKYHYGFLVHQYHLVLTTLYILFDYSNHCLNNILP